MKRHLCAFISGIAAISCFGNAGAQSPSEELALRLETHVYTLAADSMRGRSDVPFTDIAAAYIADRFAETGIAPLDGESYFRQFRVSGLHCKNVCGVIRNPASKFRDEYIVLGAHYDHLGVKVNGKDTVIYNGADDNASGVAALIEVGRILEKNRNKLKRSVILVAFDAEEKGLHGSRHFTDNPPVPLDNIMLMISMDMVGWYGTSGSLYIYGTGTMDEGKRIVIETENKYGLNLKVRKFERSILTATDTEPFAKKGIPTIHVTTGMKSPCHKPEDKAELIDYEGLANVTQYMADFTMSISANDTYRKSGKVAPVHSQERSRVHFGLTFNVGSNRHHYSSESPLTGKRRFAFGAGLFSQFDMGRSGNFALRPEVFYERAGARHPDGTLWTNAVTAPLSFILQTPSNNNYGMNISLGGYYSQRFSGTQGGVKADFTGAYYRNEGGITWGLGVRLRRVALGYNMRYSLTDLLRHELGNGANIRNRTAYFNIMYIF